MPVSGGASGRDIAMAIGSPLYAKGVAVAGGVMCDYASTHKQKTAIS